MSINNFIFRLNILIIFFTFIICKIDKNRHNGYNFVYDCLGDNKDENDSNAVNKIQIPEDCFDESPFRKYKCCYFEYFKGKEWKTGCMKVLKGDDEDLNDLKYFVSKLSSDTVFNCRQYYLKFKFSFGILFSLLLFLF